MEHQIAPGGCSRKLQRAIVDFGAEESFRRAAERIKEHHGVEISAWSARAESYAHARKVGAALPAAVPPSAQLVAEIDGSMIPIVSTPSDAADKRVGRKTCWREVRVCLARDSQSATPVYGATLGSASVAGDLWLQVAQAAGLTSQSHVHAVADGAVWIYPEVQKQFGDKASYLIDFYHVSEYLAAAAPQVKDTNAWLKRQQGHLMENRSALVLRGLSRRQEPPGRSECPVSNAHRYIRERREHMDYAGARKRNLPIGSGEVEGAHRHLVQKRLKIPGAWKEQNAQLMLSLRAARANGLWSKSWNTVLN